MIELIATAESIGQAKKLLQTGVDKIVIGEEVYGLRLPGYFSKEEMSEVIDLAHAYNSKVIIAANAILHNDKINTARKFLKTVKELGADELMVGDTGLIQILKEKEYFLPYTYDASVLATNPKQINFWSKFGAISALIANEVPYVEMIEMVKEAETPLTTRVYGAMCIHQSGRKLIENYFNYVGKNTNDIENKGLFLSEPNKDETHYSIYQDSHGTHVFANDDINLMPYLQRLTDIHIEKWYLDGIYTPGEDFVEIVKLFNEARKYLTEATWNDEVAEKLNKKLKKFHPKNREIGTGFFLYEADTVR